MDFLESAVILIPALTGMALTIYDGIPDILNQFESQYCFSPQLQKIYTGEMLYTFLKDTAEDYIYDLEEPMGTRLIIFTIGKSWILLGPYVEESWNERAARLLLMKLGASETVLPMYKAYRCRLPMSSPEFAIKTAFLLVEKLNGKAQEVQTFRLDAESLGISLTWSDLYTNAYETNRRYEMQNQFVIAISQGDRQKACWALKEARAASTGIYCLSDSLKDQLAGAAIVRTMIREGGVQAGLSPVMIDSILQGYTQKMHHTVSKEDLDNLISQLIIRFCAEVHEHRKTGYSSIVYRAIDYMSINLSKPMTTREVAKAGNENYQSFVRRFYRETGVTVKEYLTRKRCSVAAELLLHSDASIQEIAAYVGYPDNSYFSRVFKRVRGISPLNYRQLQWNECPIKK